MIAIIDYGLNDTTQLAESLLSIKADFIITRNERDILDSKKVIINDSPNISKAVKKIHLFNLFSLLRIQKKPILGISLGMELLCNKTEEGLACLGLIPIETKEIPKVDYISQSKSNWHAVHQIKSTRLFEKIPNDSEFYFDTPYFVEVVDSTFATTGNDNLYSAAIIKDHFYGVQFLPEKSGEYGLQLLENFVKEC